ncbi:MAG: C40 family peptidase [Bacilli bacterium]|nr:C40 family peptidase [Bacilli bacterium]
MKLFIFLISYVVFLFGDNRLALLETEAKSYLGGTYVWGGVNPSGFDCSGYTRYVYSKIGVELPRTAVEQADRGRQVSRDNLEKGDLLFFLTDHKRGLPITHVGIYLGNGQFIHAAGKDEGIITSSLSGKYSRLFVKATRPTELNLEIKDAVMTQKFFSIEYEAIHSQTRVNLQYKPFSIQNGKYVRQ